MSRGDDVADRSVRWQFTLRTAMLAVTVFCAMLGIGVWKGVATAAGCFAAASACCLGLAVYRRRKRSALCAGACLFAAMIAVALCYFAPKSVECSMCCICHKERMVSTFLGVKWQDAERDTELSEWYHRVGLRSHKHRWTLVWSAVHDWGGGWVHSDSFGWNLYPLDLLRDASKEIDPVTFEDLAEQYWAVCQTPDKWPDFAARCREIVPEEDATEPDPTVSRSCE